MEIVKRLVRAINVNYVLGAVAAAALLYVLTTPVVIDPLIAFVLAGIVPGTDIVLAPDTVLRLLGAAVSAIIMAMLVIWLIRRLLVGAVDDDAAIARTITHAELAASAEHLSVVERVRATRDIRRSVRQSIRAASPVPRQAPLSFHGISRPLRHVSTHAVDYPMLTPLTSLAVSGLWWALRVLELIAAGLGQLARTLLFAVGMILLVAKFLLIAMVEGAVQCVQLLVLGLRLALKNRMMKKSRSGFRRVLIWVA